MWHHTNASRRVCCAIRGTGPCCALCASRQWSKKPSQRRRPVDYIGAAPVVMYIALAPPCDTWHQLQLCSPRQRLRSSTLSLYTPRARPECLNFSKTRRSRPRPRCRALEKLCGVPLGLSPRANISQQLVSQVPLRWIQASLLHKDISLQTLALCVVPTCQQEMLCCKPAVRRLGHGNSRVRYVFFCIVAVERELTCTSE